MRFHDQPPPTTDERIAAWEAVFAFKMPADLKAFLRKSDGPVLFDDRTKKELQFLSATDAIEYYDCYGIRTVCPNAIPISMDGSGNFVVYKVEDHVIRGIHAMAAGNLGWEDSAFLCDDLKALIALPEPIDRYMH